jgi:hypothetical protein
MFGSSHGGYLESPPQTVFRLPAKAQEKIKPTVGCQIARLSADSRGKHVNRVLRRVSS